MTESSPPPLAGVRVIDLTAIVFGPLATQVLADYGADVIKVEPPEGDILRHAGAARRPGMGAIFLNCNRGKRSVALDLKTAGGRAALARLIAGADVFVHNMRRGAIARLGFAPADLLARHPRLLYCAGTGFPESSARRDDVAIDEIVQAASGLAALNAGPDGAPRLVPSVLADKTAGLALACAILAGLVRRAATGRGGLIDVPMYDTFAAFTLAEHLQGETYRPALGGVGYARVLPEARRLYRARDGHLTLTPYTAPQWQAFFRAVGRPEMAEDARVTDPVRRNRHIRELYDMVEALAPSRTVAEWLALAAELGVPAGRVAALADVAADPELERSGTIRAIEQPGDGPVRMLASPGLFDGAAQRHPGPAPRLGEHTRAALAETGMTAAEIAELVNAGAAIAPPPIAGEAG